MATKIVKNASTKVLSARVSPDVYIAWNTLAQAQNKSVSECLRDAVTMVDKKAIIKAQDGIVVPDEFNEMLLGVVGGGVAGTLLYKGIHVTLKKNYPKMTQIEIEAISSVLALGGAVIIGMGIYKALK